MIKVNFSNEDITHNVFEFLRITFPSYERNRDMTVDIETSDSYLVSIRSEEINTDFYVEKVEDKRDQKYRFKQELYKNLHNRFEYKDDWGILTGVKPIKLVLKLLQDNSEEEVRNMLKDYYLLSDKAVNLAMSIAEIEKKHVYPLDRNRYNLYIHIPFCPTKCSYCSFLTLNSSRELTAQYTEALTEELKRTSEIIEKEPRTIYIGGGTPTALQPEELEKIIKTVNRYYGKSSEFTVECGRPDTINRDILNMLKENGVNRISINPQSMNDRTLQLIGRSHSVDDIVRTYREAEEIGFNSVNMDMIIGLPGEGIKEVKKTLDEIFRLNPENITIHTLALKNGSKLYDRKYDNIDDIEDILNLTKTKTAENGYRPYYMYRQKRMTGNGENIGYCREGFESVYNIVMMEEKESVIGLGMCSTSKFYFEEKNRLEKVMQYRNISDYLNKTDEIIKRRNKLINKFNF